MFSSAVFAEELLQDVEAHLGHGGVGHVVSLEEPPKKTPEQGAMALRRSVMPGPSIRVMRDPQEWPVAKA